MHFYAGDTDNVVTSVSALDVFPPANTGVIRGDHSSIIQPQGTEDDAYVVLRTHIDDVIQTLATSTTDDSTKHPETGPLDASLMSQNCFDGRQTTQHRD